jgi:hypothetical protein
MYYQNPRFEREAVNILLECSGEMDVNWDQTIADDQPTKKEIVPNYFVQRMRQNTTLPIKKRYARMRAQTTDPI